MVAAKVYMAVAGDRDHASLLELRNQLLVRVNRLVIRIDCLVGRGKLLVGLVQALDSLIELGLVLQIARLILFDELLKLCNLLLVCIRNRGRI